MNIFDWIGKARAFITSSDGVGQNWDRQLLIKDLIRINIIDYTESSHSSCCSMFWTLELN